MISQLSALLALGAPLAAAVQPLVVQGNFFVNPSTGNRFEIVGAAYQPGGSSGFQPQLGKDPLSDKDSCLRDAALMQLLGVNAIRVYNLDPDLNHDECASIFNAAGMYMLLDVNSPLPGQALNSAEPWTTYDSDYLNRTFAIVEAFKNYPNTLAFFSGNEVMDDVATGSTAPPYVRAVTRDLKAYIAKHSERTIPVGYSAADVRSILFDSWNYLQCAIDGDQNDSSRADLFALNSYSWCGESSFTTSSYDSLVAGFNESSIPIFFSEFGCNTPSPRVFTEVPVIYGPLMTPVFSGAVVYEFAEEANNFGLVNINSDGSASLLLDFTTLQGQYATLDFASLQDTQAPPASSAPAAPACSADLITTSGFSTNFTLPVLPPGAQDIIDNGVSPTPSGKLVNISSWIVTQTVLTNASVPIQGLAVKPLADDSTNQPGSNNITTDSGNATTTSTDDTSSTTSSSPAASTTKSAASALHGSSSVAAAALAGLFALVAAVAL